MHARFMGGVVPLQSRLSEPKSDSGSGSKAMLRPSSIHFASIKDDKSWSGPGLSCAVQGRGISEEAVNCGRCQETLSEDASQALRASIWHEPALTLTEEHGRYQTSAVSDCTDHPNDTLPGYWHSSNSGHACPRDHLAAVSQADVHSTSRDVAALRTTNIDFYHHSNQQ